MGSGLRKKSNHKGLTYAYNNCYTPHKDHIKWDTYCINNNIRISPVPTERGPRPEEWRIEVRLGPYKKGEKGYLSPNVYDCHSILIELERMKRYYYDKNTLQNNNKSDNNIG
tara:strand:- start:2152 stop:2487 length:336 start_codon:yes stop_codon:yes gene_type:complete